MEDNIKITITEYQRELLLKHVALYILDEGIQRAISTVISKNGKCNIHLTLYDIEELIGDICFVSNHEEKNKKLVLELDELSDYLESVLNENE